MSFSLDFLKPYDMTVRGSGDAFYILGTGATVPSIENRDKVLIVAALRYWADRLEAE